MSEQVIMTGTHPRWRGFAGWASRLAMTTAVIAAILWRLDLDMFGHVVVSPHWVPLVAMGATAVLFLFLGALKLWLLLAVFAPAGFRLFTVYYFFAVSIGSLAPAMFGDFSLLMLLRREGIPIHQALSAVLVDRVITLAACALIFTPCTISLLVSGSHVLLLSLGGAVAIGVAAWGWRWAEVPLPSLYRRFPRLERFLNAILELLQGHRANLAGNIGITLIRCVASGISVELALLGAGQPASLLPTTCISNTMSVIGLLPITLAGLGVYEGTGVVIFEQLGLNRERVFAGLVYQRAYIIVSSLVIAAVSLILFAFKRRAGWTLVQGAAHYDQETEA